MHRDVDTEVEGRSGNYLERMGRSASPLPKQVRSTPGLRHVLEFLKAIAQPSVTRTARPSRVTPPGSRLEAFGGRLMDETAGEVFSVIPASTTPLVRPLYRTSATCPRTCPRPAMEVYFQPTLA